jgi:hypothetical protein
MGQKYVKFSKNSHYGPISPVDWIEVFLSGGQLDLQTDVFTKLKLDSKNYLWLNSLYHSP